MPKHSLSINAFGMCGYKHRTAHKENVYDVSTNDRHTNLSLLQAYGSNSWKIHNYLLESNATRLEKAVEQLKERTVEVNRDRKNDQVWMLYIHI
jgi:Breast carcinoma amplified sequence 2 (BCAS2)